MTKITVDKALMEQAIEALEKCYDVDSYPSNGKTKQDAALNALRTALAEPASNGKLFHAEFNVGDHVFYMKDNKPTEVVISAIEVFFVNTSQDRITYNVKNATHSGSWLDHTKLQEAQLFRTKHELLESL